MAGGKLSGIPSLEEQEKTADKSEVFTNLRIGRGVDGRGMTKAEMAVSEVRNREYDLIEAALDHAASAIKRVPRGKGRGLNIQKLRDALSIVEQAGVRLSGGDRTPAVKLVAQEMRVPDATARDILRRLVKVKKRWGI